MGNTSSRIEDQPALLLTDPQRFVIRKATISTPSRDRTTIIEPDPATGRITVRKEYGDSGAVEFVQDPETPPNAPPAFLLKVSNDEDVFFTFELVLQQSHFTSSDGVARSSDNTIHGLTYVFGSNNKDLDGLMTREFHADPNLHKNPNVQLVRQEWSTSNERVTVLEWTWKWQPPKAATDERLDGWRNACTFVEYNQRAHRLERLATFHFWVANTRKHPISPLTPTIPTLDSIVVPKIRVASSHSMRSGISDSDGGFTERELPTVIPEDDVLASESLPKEQSVFDVNCIRPNEDLAIEEDGPVFRATMKALEQKTGNMKQRIKRVLKKAEAAQMAQTQCNEAVSQFLRALRDTSTGSGSEVQPALDHYFGKIAEQIQQHERYNTENLQKTIIDPLSKLYVADIKQAETKRREFEDESKEYYAYVGRYLGQRQDSLKDKKRAESDTKYENKKRNFELSRFDYSAFMQDLHGGKKEQDVLSQLTMFADNQAQSFVSTAKQIEEMLPQLKALVKEVKEADKDFQLQRTGREEKRRTLQKGFKLGDIEPPVAVNPNGATGEMKRATSQQHGFRQMLAGVTHSHSISASTNTYQPSNGSKPVMNPLQTTLSRETDEKNASAVTAQKKEGIVWALSRPGSHVDPRGLNKQAWHKFWIVLDQGKLSEYTNWKERLDLHMEPIDLRLASVREARNAERRFCFEVITLNFKRVYQATSEDDMQSWITAINNALQGAFERNEKYNVSQMSPDGPNGKEFGAVLRGKSYANHHHSPSIGNKLNGSPVTNIRRTSLANIATRPSPQTQRTHSSTRDDSNRVLQDIRARDAGNATCADCRTSAKVDWTSINLGVILCIECSGLHRSLGTHVSKIRSLTLDTCPEDIVEILLSLGNRLANQVWEATLDETRRPQPGAPHEERIQFITDKYIHRAFVDPSAPAYAQFRPEDVLLTSIKKTDIQGVLYALARGASPNTSDKSRGTHSVLLALASTDPASPLPPGSPSLSRQPSNITTRFPIAELLLQNGADLPNAKTSPIPLSVAATAFLEQRRPKTVTPTSPSPNLNNATLNVYSTEGQRTPRSNSAQMGTPISLTRSPENKLRKTPSSSVSAVRFGRS